MDGSAENGRPTEIWWAWNIKITFSPKITFADNQQMFIILDMKPLQSLDRLLPTSNGRLLHLCDIMAIALKANETGIRVKHNTLKRLNADLSSFRKLDGQFTASRSRRKDLLTPELKQADQDGRKFIVDSRHLLTKSLGKRYSQDWIDAGFLNGSLGIPTKCADRIVMVGALAEYLLDHPAVENDSLGVTAAIGTKIHTRLSTLQAAILDHESKEGELSTQRTRALTALRKRIQDLVDELGQLLPDDDQRWIAFGLDTPASRKRKRAAARAAAAAEADSKITQLPVQGSSDSKAA
jgi:hypothetical protein